MKKKIAIIDYGLGNIFSVQQSFLKVIKDNKFNATVLTTNKLEDVKDSTHIVLPGQGAFSACMKGLVNIEGMIDELSKNILSIDKLSSASNIFFLKSKDILRNFSSL